MMESATIPGSAAAPTVYRVDDLQIDVERRRVTRGAEELPVVGISFDLLLVLLCAAPKLVSVEELMQRVWRDLVVSPETVSQRIKIVRRALNDDADNPRYVAGVRGRGYRVIATVTPVPTTDSGGHVRTAPGLVAGAVPLRPRRPYLRWCLCAAALVALLAAALVGRLPKHAPIAAVTREGIAVLPFVNLTGDPDKDYLGEGMAEEVINMLSKVPGLRVPARTSSFAYQGRRVDIRQIARDLGVGTVLEGSVREAGTRIRVTAQLINARDGLHLWSQTYDQKFMDLFTLQDDLASAITQALKVNLGVAIPASIPRTPPTKDVQAYDLYLQGVALSQRGGAQSLERAAELFQQAVTQDPLFARAYAGLSTAKYLTAVLYGRQPVENLAAAERAADQSLQLDASLADAQMALAQVAFIRGHSSDAGAHVHAALSLNPNDGLLHMQSGAGLDAFGHLREALEEQDKAHALAPASPPVATNQAVAYSMLGRDSDALKSARLALDLGMSQANPGLALVFEQAGLRSGHYADAAAAAVAALDVTNPDQARTAQIMRLVYAAMADPDKRAAAMAARVRLYPPLDHSRHSASATFNAAPCLQSSYAYALLGELDVAYGMTNQCLNSMAPGSLWFGVASFRIWAPELRRFREDARFQAFVTRLGYMENWQQDGPPDGCDLKDDKLSCH